MIGDDLGFEGANLLDFEVLADGDILFVLSRTKTLPGIGTVTPRDVIRLHPTSHNPVRSGVFTFELIGATVGLTTTSENIDAVAVTSNGHLVISTIGTGTLNGVGTVQDEDLVEINGATASLYFDGSAVGLTSSSEDITAAAIADANSVARLYLATKGNFAVQSKNELQGKSRDGFSCSFTSMNPINQCFFAKLFDGKKNGFGKGIDGLSFAPVSASVVNENSATEQTPAHNVTETDSDDDSAAMIGDLPYAEAISQGDPEITVDDAMDMAQEVYLPLIMR